MKKYVYAILLALFFLFAGAVSSLQIENESPVESSEIFNKNGFSMDKVSVKKRNVIVDNGIFNLEFESSIDTQIYISIHKEQSEKWSDTLCILGKDGNNTCAKDNCLQEKKDKKFFIQFCLPNKVKYVLDVLGKSGEDSYTCILRYIINTKTGYDYEVFITDAFYKAVESKNEDMINAIHIDEKNRPILQKKDKNGQNMLMRVCGEGKAEMAERLLGNFINSKSSYYTDDDGKKVYSTSVLFDINDADNAGRTALMFAGINGHENVVRLLLEKNVVHYMKSNDNMTALDYALKSKNKKIIELFDNYQDLPASVDIAELKGEWMGVIFTNDESILNYGSYIMNIDLKNKIDDLTGEASITSGLTADENRNLFSNGKLPEPCKNNYEKKMVCKEKFRVFINGDELFLYGENIKLLYQNEKSPSKILPFRLQFKYQKSGILSDHLNIGINCFFEKSEADFPDKKVSIEKSKTVLIQSEIFPEISYYCYVPKSYDPSHPVSVIFFMLPGAKAKPLSVKTAEELGWISVGFLYYDYSYNFKVITDVKNRFNTRGKKIYFAGFSRTGLTAHHLGVDFNPFCGGIICMGRWEALALAYGIPVFYIFGDKDELKDGYMTGDDGKKYKNFALYYKEQIKPKYTTPSELRTFPGGHAWGIPELHAEAMRWLDKINK